MGIRAAATAAFIGGYRSASNARRSALPSSSSVAAGFLLVKREWSDEEEEPAPPAPFAFVPVKEEPEEPAPLGRRGVVGPEDYVTEFDAVAAAIAGDMVCEGLPSERVGSWKREKGCALHRWWHHLWPSRRRR